MSGQELVDELRAYERAHRVQATPVLGGVKRIDHEEQANRYGRAADRIEALEAEVGEAHTHFAIQEGRIRQAYEAQDFWRQRAAELEALLDNGDPAYTTRVREEAGVKADRLDSLVRWVDHTLTLPIYQNPRKGSEAETVAAEYRHWRRLLTNGLHPSALAKLAEAGPWSEIPEGSAHADD